MKSVNGFRHILSISCGLILLLLTIRQVVAQSVFQAELPLAVTSCGQSPDAYTVSLLLKRLKLEHTFNNTLKAEELKGIKTLAVAMGGSAKGLGEAGIDEKGEIGRITALLAKARELKIKVIAIHIGGESRKGPLSDKFINPVTSAADYMIVTEDGNKDGSFTKVSKERKIPLAVVKQTSEVGRELKGLIPVK